MTDTAGLIAEAAKITPNMDALVSLDKKGALVPHGIGGHARTLLTDASSLITRLAAALAGGGGGNMSSRPSLNLATLRTANLTRQVEWARGEEVDLVYRSNELGGECGEVQNVVKKIERERRGWAGSRATVEDLANEIADVVICADLLALTEGIDLGAAVIAKFNATSEKVGMTTRLSSTPQSAGSDPIPQPPHTERDGGEPKSMDERVREMRRRPVPDDALPQRPEKHRT